MSYVLIGGTFDGLHKGHIEFIRKAFETGGKVLVCITSDEMARKKPLPDKIESYEKRMQDLVEFLRGEGWLERAETVKIEDPFTEGLRPELTHIIVSPETRKNAEKINDMRKEKGLDALEIVEIKWVLAEDCQPISDARIRKGEIDTNGKVL